jgi:predicted nucleic acid-binding protein
MSQDASTLIAHCRAWSIIHTRDRDFRRFDGIRVEDPFI